MSATVASIELAHQHGLITAVSPDDVLDMVKLQDGKVLRMNRKQRFVTPRVTRSYYVNLDGQCPTTFNGSDVTARLKQQTIMVAKDAAIEYTLAETGGSNTVTTCDPFYYNTRVNILANGSSSDLWQQISPDHVYVNFGMLNSAEKQTALALAGNFTIGATGASVAIAAGATVVVTVPLSGNVFQAQGVPIQAISGDIIFQISLRNGITSSGTGTLALNNIRIKITEEVMPNDVYKNYCSQFLNSHVNYMNYTTKTISQALAASSAYNPSNWQLTSTRGMTAMYCLIVRANAYSATTNGVTTFIQLGTSSSGNLQLLDAGGQPLTGVAPTGLEILRLYEPYGLKKGVCGNIFSNSYVYPQIFSNDMESAIKGIRDGYLTLIGAETPNLNTGTGLSSASYVVDFPAWIHRHYVCNLLSLLILSNHSFGRMST